MNNPYGSENRAALPSHSEQRGVRFPANWRPDDMPSQLNQLESSNYSASDVSGNSYLKRNGKLERSTIQRVIEYQYKYSMAALAVGAICMAIGGWLAYSGTVAKTAFAAQILSDFGFKVQMTDAGPGTILFVVALITLIATRFDIRIDS